MRQTPAPELPAGFTPRLMERIRRERERLERRETWLLCAGGLCCFAVLSVVSGWMLYGGRGEELPRFEWVRPVLPHFELRMPSFSLSAADEKLILTFGGVALIFLVLALADLLIRRRLDAANIRNGGTR